MSLVPSFFGSDRSTRFEILGCGRRLIYVCESTKRQEDLVIGTVESRCRKLAEKSTVVPEAPRRPAATQPVKGIMMDGTVDESGNFVDVGGKR